MENTILKEYNAPLKQQVVYKVVKDKVVVSLQKPAEAWKPYKSISQALYSLREVLLPSGFPHSVSDDYISYQIWDSAQAFCSGITGIFATRAILVGVGVGDSASKPLSATITWILKDGTGMCGRIVFAWLKGKNLDTDCKKWRLFADILNDAAMSIELFIPAYILFSKELLCLSTTMKAIVGVAGGATRAAITQHQALRGNTGDVSAKDGSQETFVNLCASVFGVVLLTYLQDSRWDWLLFIVFCLLHLFANYKAVKALNMKTLNEERYVLLLGQYFVSDIVLDTKKINEEESVFIGCGLSARHLCNFNIRMGSSLNDVCIQITPEALNRILNIYEREDYFLILHPTNRTICVLLKEEEDTDTVLSAYFSAIYYGFALSIYNHIAWKKSSHFQLIQNPLNRLREININPNKNKSGKIFDLSIEDKVNLQKLVSQEYSEFRQRAILTGWDFNFHQLNIDEWRYKI